MKNIEKLQTVKSDAYDYYMSGTDDMELFEKVFLVGDIVDEIEKPDKFFIVGEKGSGKTAYSVYMSKRTDSQIRSSITMVEGTLYRRFIHMKMQKMLELSDMKDIWINLIYLVLAERVKEIYRKDFFASKKMRALEEAIQSFYSDAFKPELVNALEFVENASESLNVMIKKNVFGIKGGTKKENQQKYVEQTYQISLMKIQKEFEEAFASLHSKHPYILFIDGVDARPASIENQVYFDCIAGMVDAVIDINRVLAEKNIKIMPLMRPDVMYRLPIHNMNQKLRNNTVLLSWGTSYRDYLKSKLFKLADGYFAGQQAEEYGLAECWNSYFPYKVPSKNTEQDNAFIEFLRYSSYKPRDILTMLNGMIETTSGKCFKHQDFKRMLSNYSDYLEGELKDYLLIYMTDEDFVNFRSFFDYFHGYRDFDYVCFQDRHKMYVKSLNELHRRIPKGMETANEALQLLYEAGIIGYKERITTYGGEEVVRSHWSFKERNYANMRPAIRPNGEYLFHMAYANAFGIV